MVEIAIRLVISRDSTVPVLRQRMHEDRLMRGIVDLYCSRTDLRELVSFQSARKARAGPRRLDDIAGIVVAKKVTIPTMMVAPMRIEGSAARIS